MENLYEPKRTTGFRDIWIIVTKITKYVWPDPPDAGPPELTVITVERGSSRINSHVFRRGFKTEPFPLQKIIEGSPGGAQGAGGKEHSRSLAKALLNFNENSSWCSTRNVCQSGFEIKSLSFRKLIGMRGSTLESLCKCVAICCARCV